MIYGEAKQMARLKDELMKNQNHDGSGSNRKVFSLKNCRPIEMLFRR